MERKKLNPAITAIIVVVLVGIVTTAIIVLNNKKSTSDTADSTATTTPATTETKTEEVATTAATDTANTAATTEYKDGTYTKTGSYASPGGKQSITLTVTIANDTITETSIVQNASDSESKEHQAEFASGYKALVVGKKVDSVSLSRVAGSSLTSTGFNTALTQIKADATS